MSSTEMKWNFEEKDLRHDLNSIPKPFLIVPIKNEPIPGYYISNKIINTNTNTNANTNINLPK